MRLTYLLLFFLAACSSPPQDITLASLFTDHMVLQQQTEVSIWGWASPGKKVKVSGSWDNEVVSENANKEGYWLVKLKTPEAGGPYTLTIHNATPIVLSDVMIGEVWIAGGQSNMEWPLNQSEAGAEAIAAAQYPDIRFFHVAHAVAKEPAQEVEGRWQVCSPDSIENFSAVAYHFGLKLNQQLDVPIGLIGSYWGGTPAQAWTSRAGLSEDPDVKILLDRYDSDLETFEADSNLANPVRELSPTCLYNAMIHPLQPYTLQGAIWYQGEANVTDPYLYRRIFPAMIRDWRNGWGKEFPFYFVQLAPYQYEVPYSGAGLREAQMMTLNVPHTGMAVTLDVGNPQDIHPRNKKTVGDRLAQIALARTYQQEGIVASGPLYASMAKRGREVKLFFAHTADLLVAKDGPLTHFTVAGPDRIFYEANARIDDDTTIVVSSPSVSNPLAVRFAFSDTAQPNLYNQAGLPASSFRTDGWPMFFSLPEIQATYLKDRNDFLVTMDISGPAKELRYTLDGRDPTRFSTLYQGPVRVRQSGVVKVRVFQDGFPSQAIVEKELIRHEGMNAEISLARDPSPKYPGGKAQGLADGITGSIAFLDPAWQGYEAQDMEVIFDMGQELNLSTISLHCLEDPPAWIFYPESITFMASVDGQSYETLGSQNPEVAGPKTSRSMQTFSQPLPNKRYRYFKVIAKNRNTCPDWHQGAGGNSWIFMDEVIVE